MSSRSPEKRRIDSTRARRPASPPDREPIRIGGLLITPGDPRVVIDGRVVYLSLQQLTLLQILASNAGQVVSTLHLASSLGRGGKPISNTGLWIHVHRLRTLLNSASLLIRTVRRSGYVLEQDTAGHPPYDPP